MGKQSTLVELFNLQKEALEYIGANREGIVTHTFNKMMAEEMGISDWDKEDIENAISFQAMRDDDQAARFKYIMQHLRMSVHEALLEFETLLKIEKGGFVSYAQSSGAQYIASIFKGKIGELVGWNKEWLDEVFVNFDWFEYGIFSHCEPKNKTSTSKAAQEVKENKPTFRRIAYSDGERPELGERKMYRSNGYLKRWPYIHLALHIGT